MSMLNHTAHRTLFVLGVLVAGALIGRSVAAQSPLEQGFRQPPDSTRPWCYWYWISDNISKEGITRDLEAMARVGIGEALIGNVFFEDTAPGDVKVLSEQWWGIIEHAIREGGRVGVDIAMFNCPGWSQSGGPWIKPQQAMRYLVSSETRVQGPRRFQQQLPAPKDPFQDVAVLAFLAPLADAESLAAHTPKVSCEPSASDVEKAVDGQTGTVFAFPAGAGQGDGRMTVAVTLAEPLTVRQSHLGSR